MILSLSKSNKAKEPLTNAEYKACFEAYYEPVRNFIYFKSGDAELAEDIAQDTFIKLWENRDGIERKTIKAYLYTIAGNLTINYLKRQQLKYKFVNRSQPRTEKMNPEYIAEMAEFNDELQAVLASIPEGSREVFLMNRIEDLKYREIAERLGVSVKAVEKRMSKALQILREKLNIDV